MSKRRKVEVPGISGTIFQYFPRKDTPNNIDAITKKEKLIEKIPNDLYESCLFEQNVEEVGPPGISNQDQANESEITLIEVDENYGESEEDEDKKCRNCENKVRIMHLKYNGAIISESYFKRVHWLICSQWSDILTTKYADSLRLMNFVLKLRLIMLILFLSPIINR